jgi:PAS domain S-box-containing protein
MDKNIITNLNVLDHGKDGVMIVDQDQVVTYINKSGLQILRTDEGVIGEKVVDVFRICNYYTGERYNDLISTVFITKEPTGLKKESALRKFDDSMVFVSASISPIIDGDVKGAVIFFKDISRLKETERELTKFRKTIENSIEAVVITNAKWQVEYCNEKAKKRMKHLCEDNSQNFWEICKYQVTWMEKDVIFEDLAKDFYWVGDVRGSGIEEKWFRVSIVVLRDVVGNIINYVISEVDVSFEKESKRLLVNERKNLSTIIEGAPVGMITVTQEMNVLQINEECRSVLGINLKRSQNVLRQLEVNENLEIAVELIKKVQKTNAAIRNYEFFVMRELRGEKRKRWIKANAVPIIISEKKCVLLSFEDETIKKDMAKTIVRNERQLRLVTDNMQDIIIQVSLTGDIEYFSSSFKHYIDIEYANHNELSIFDVVLKGDHEIIKRMMKKCKDSKEDLKFEIRFHGKENTELWIEVMMKYLQNEEGIISFLLYGRDVTQRRIAEQEIVNSKELAIAANNAKSEFLANMSHEIRTPLNGIIGMANIALMNSEDLKQKDNVTMIKHSAENLLKIINSVLDFSKIEAGKLTLESNNFNLKEELKRFLNPFSIQASQKDIGFKSTIDDKINDRLLGDITRVLQVITNLIGNAVKFTEFGAVSFTALCVKEDDDTQWIQFNVKDTGIGIREDDKHKIFESFSQADGSVTRKFGGTGLGLNITKKIVELMQGQIVFSSNFGKGTEFICTLPFKKTTAKVRPKLDETVVEKDAIGVGYNILVVEDDKINQKLAHRLLKRKGYGITIVSNGLEAVNIYEDNRFDLILMDIQMPIMDGLTATKKIREKANAFVPIIALTAYAIKGDREKFLRKGMDDYISKPIDLDEFYSVLEKHLVKKSEDSSIQKILERLDKSKSLEATNVKQILEVNFTNINMQLKYIASAINKRQFEKLEERCYAFKNYVTSIKLKKLRQLVFDLELHLRKENDEMVLSSYKTIVKYIEEESTKSLKGVEINEDFNSRG